MNETQTIAKLVIAAGVAVVVLGFLLLVGSRFGLGSLPGDIRLKGEGWGCFLPITTSILLSLLLTLALNLIWRLWR